VAYASALLFDLGGTHLRCACLTPKGAITNITQERIRCFRDDISPAEIWSELLAKMSEYALRSNRVVEELAPIVISFPGPLNEDGTLVNAPTVSGIDRKVPDIRAKLSSSTGRMIHVLNDVSAATLYLARHTAWSRFMVVTVSSGIGSKVCFRNRYGFTLFDQGPYAGEIGHLTVDESAGAPTCDCGGKGHLGAIASGRGVECLARRRAASDRRAFSESFCNNVFGATALTLNNEEHIVAAVRAGDRWSLDVLREGTRPLAFVLNTAILALGLQGVLVIGGFAFAIGEVYLTLLRELIKSRCDYSALNFSPEMVQFGNMCDEACLRGAAEFANIVEDGHSRVAANGGSSSSIPFL